MCSGGNLPPQPHPEPSWRQIVAATGYVCSIHPSYFLPPIFSFQMATDCRRCSPLFRPRFARPPSPRGRLLDAPANICSIHTSYFLPSTSSFQMATDCRRYRIARQLPFLFPAPCSLSIPPYSLIPPRFLKSLIPSPFLKRLDFTHLFSYNIG